MTTRHSVCPHVAATNQQPLAAFTDANGRETFNCASCSASEIGSMLSTHSPIEIVNAVSFRRCNHGLNLESDFCHACFNGVTFFLQSVAWHFMWTDRHFGNRLRKIVEKLSIANGQMRRRHSERKAV